MTGNQSIFKQLMYFPLAAPFRSASHFYCCSSASNDTLAVVRSSMRKGSSFAMSPWGATTMRTPLLRLQISTSTQLHKPYQGNRSEKRDQVRTSGCLPSLLVRPSHYCLMLNLLGRVPWSSLGLNPSWTDQGLLDLGSSYSFDPICPSVLGSNYFTTFALLLPAGLYGMMLRYFSWTLFTVRLTLSPFSWVGVGWGKDWRDTPILTGDLLFTQRELPSNAFLSKLQLFYERSSLTSLCFM